MTETMDRSKLFEALSLAQGQFKKAIKDASNPFFKSNYADFESIIDAVRPALAANGLCILQPTTVIGDKLYVQTIVAHKSGQMIDGLYPVVAMKQDPQALGSAITYAKRYGAAAMLGVITSEDDDGEAAMIRTQVPAPAVNKPIVNHAPKPNMQITNLSEAQIKRAHAMAHKLNWKKEEFDGFILKMTQKSSIKDLSPTEYQQVTNEMDIQIKLAQAKADNEIPF
jgi:hypothetical protein